jgi:hypothetical protein
MNCSSCACFNSLFTRSLYYKFFNTQKRKIGMKMNKIMAVVALGVLSVGAYAQDAATDDHTATVGVPEVFIVDIEPQASKNITVGPTAPVEAGEGLDFSSATNSDLWLNYSSIVENGTSTRNVTAAITAGTVPAGLTLSASADAGNGDGTVGTQVGSAITLSGTAQNLVTGIGSCYTGDGANNGHNLTYAVSLTAGAGNYASLFTDNNDVLTVTYTITD